MLKITIVYENPDQLQKFRNDSFPQNPIVECLDMNTLAGRKAGFKIKRAYGARKNPFCLVEDGNPLKVFYSENDYEDDAITQLIRYLHGESI